MKIAPLCGIPFNIIVESTSRLALSRIWQWYRDLRCSKPRRSSVRAFGRAYRSSGQSNDPRRAFQCHCPNHKHPFAHASPSAYRFSRQSYDPRPILQRARYPSVYTSCGPGTGGHRSCEARTNTAGVPVQGFRASI